ncbi:hypothetical protein LINGRAHAP2_LOCUS24195 [Linum grandiflorum]
MRASIARTPLKTLPLGFSSMLPGLIRHRGIETESHDDLEEVRTKNENSRRRGRKMSLHVGIFAANIPTGKRIFRRIYRELGPKICSRCRNIHGKYSDAW